jgi:hypothetical protein
LFSELNQVVPFVQSDLYLGSFVADALQAAYHDWPFRGGEKLNSSGVENACALSIGPGDIIHST